MTGCSRSDAPALPGHRPGRILQSADRSEGGTLYLLATDSGDLWGTEDRFSFAYSPERAPAFDTWTAAVATTSNNSVEDWGKVALMARASLSPNAPYFAVGRAADSHGLVIQYRSTGCGNPPNSSPCGTAQHRLGNRDNIGDENIQFIRLEVKRSDAEPLPGLWLDRWLQLASDWFGCDPRDRPPLSGNGG